MRPAFLVLCMAPLLCGLAFGALQCKGIQDRLAGLLEQHLFQGEGVSLRIEGLSGLLPVTAHVERLSLSDPSGEWAEVRDLHLALSVGDLLRGRLTLPFLFVDRVTLLRKPLQGGGVPKERTLSPVDIPRIRIARLEVFETLIGPEILGREARFTLSARMEAGRGRVGVEAGAREWDGQGRFHLKAEVAEPGGFLAVEGDMEALPGGMLPRLLGLGPNTGITLRLSGKGPLADWPGTLFLEVQEAWRLEARLHLLGKNVPRLAAEGGLLFDGGVLPASLGARTNKEIPISCLAALEGGERLRVEVLRLALPTLDLDMTGSLDLGDLTQEGSLEILIKDPETLLQGTGLSIGRPMPVEIRFTGPLTDPYLDIAFQAESLSMGGVTGKGAALELQGPLACLWNEKDLARVRATLFVSGLSLPFRGVPTLPLRLSMDTGIRGFEVFEVPRVRASLGPLACSGAGWLTHKGQGALDLDLEAEDLSAMLGSALPGFPAMPVKGRLQARAPDGVQKGGNIGLSLEGPLARLAGEGRLLPDLRAFEADARLDIEDLAPLAGLLPATLLGALTLRGKASGSFRDFEATLEGTSQGLTLEGIPLEALSVGLLLSDLPGRLQGKLRAEARLFGCDLEAEAGVALPGEGFDIASARIHGSGLSLEGDLRVRGGAAEGRVRGSLEDLGVLGGLLGGDLGGRVRFSLQVRPDGDGQAAGVSVEGRELHLGKLSVKEARIRGDLTGTLETPSGDLTLGVTDLRAGDRVRVSGTVGLRGERKACRISLAASGDAWGPMDLEAGGRVNAEGAEGRLTLHRLRGTVLGRPLSLPDPLRAVLGPDGLTLAPWVLRLGGAEVHGRGAFLRDTVSAGVKSPGIPLPLLTPLTGVPLEGEASFDMEISGRPGGPRVDFQAGLRHLHFPGGPRGARGPEMTLNLRGTAEAGHLRGEAGITGLGKDPLVAHWDLPLTLSLSPLVLDLPGTGAFLAALEGPLDLGVLGALPGLEGLLFSGTALANLLARGSLEAPEIEGRIRMESGRIEVVDAGLLVEDISLDLTGRNRGIRLDRLEGSDGAGGRIHVEGALDLSPEKGFPFRVEARLQKARLLQTELLTTTADGTLLFQGSREGADLSGRILFDPTLMGIPERLNKGPVDLAVTEINRAEGDPRGPVKGGPSFPLIRLDLTLGIPARCVIRGRGLDAELAGDLRVLGTSASPDLRGDLHLVRGTFRFLDRVFSLTQGTVLLSGTRASEVLLKMEARVAASDITARIALDGPADAFKISLSSTPDLPQEEILARILFKRPAGSLNPLQAAQLAFSLSELTGKRLFPDLLGMTRRALGVDRLDIQSETGTGETSLSIGKYVSETVYVGVIQNLQSGGQDIKVEAEITPSLSLEGRAGAISGAGIGLTWRYDY